MIQKPGALSVRFAVHAMLCLVLLCGGAAQVAGADDDHHNHEHGHGHAQKESDHGHKQPVGPTAPVTKTKQDSVDHDHGHGHGGHDHHGHKHSVSETGSVTKTEEDFRITPLPLPKMTPALKAFQQDEVRKLARAHNWLVMVTHHGGEATIEANGSGVVEIVSSKGESRPLELDGKMWLSSIAADLQHMRYYEKLRRDDKLILRLREDSDVRVSAKGSVAVQVGDSSERRVELDGDISCWLRGDDALVGGAGGGSAKLYGFDTVRPRNTFTPSKIYTEKCSQVWVAGKTEAYAQNCQTVYAEGESRLIAEECSVVRLKEHSIGRLRKCPEAGAEDSAIIYSDDRAMLLSMSGKALRKNYNDDEVLVPAGKRHMEKCDPKR